MLTHGIMEINKENRQKPGNGFFDLSKKKI